MKLKDRAVTCIHCGAYEVVTTDPWYPKAGFKILEKQDCTCTGQGESAAGPAWREVPTGRCLECDVEVHAHALRCEKHARIAHQKPKACVDCGEPCRAKRCLACASTIHASSRRTKEPKPLPHCETCQRQLEAANGRFCRECRAEKNREESRAYQRLKAGRRRQEERAA